jgi:hypothetical protein
MSIKENILQLQTSKHPAFSMPFDALYQGLQKELLDGNVSVVTSNDLELYNYTIQCQFDNLWNIFSLMARGLILCPKEKKVIAAPFPKFFNYGELTYSLPSEPFSTTEKMDGCCDSNSIIKTTDGDKTIQEICETKYKGKVLSFNIFLQKEEMDTIVGHSILPNTEQWYEIELGNGAVLRLTGNHEVYLPELNCYRRVDKLTGNEKLLVKK